MLGGVEVVKAILTRSNVRDQPGGLSLLRLLAPSAQLPHNVPPSQDGDVRQVVSHRRYCRRKNLIPGFHWLIRCHWLMPKDESLLLGGLPLLVGLLPVFQCTRGSGLWKLEATLGVDFHSLVVSTRRGNHPLHCCHQILQHRPCWYN